MSDLSSNDFWDSFWRPWTSASLAPQKLWQSINPGWSFGTVTINEQNSSSPQTEQAILAEESYGRQIGKLLDAVSDLARTQPDAKKNKAYAEIAALKSKVDRIKHDAAANRIDQLRRDLELLRTSGQPADREAYRQSIRALRALVLEPGAPSG
jgi:outer membrane murein-binding lipoprotein Lpp